MINQTRTAKVRKFVTIALAGQPNVGKSTVFNMLTGLSQHVGILFSAETELGLAKQVADALSPASALAFLVIQMTFIPSLQLWLLSNMKPAGGGRVSAWDCCSCSRYVLEYSPTR